MTLLVPQTGAIPEPVPNRLSEPYWEGCRRGELLFQRCVPGFEPSPQSYAPAVRALASAGDVLALNGITEPRYLDLLTALVTGLVSQQIANDPGGDRWTALIEESVAMFLAHCQAAARPSVPARPQGAPS